jgi:hypothetical protein
MGVISGDEFCPMAPDFVIEYSPPNRLAAWKQQILEDQWVKAHLELLINLGQESRDL